PDRGGDTTKEGYKAKLLAQSKIWKSEIISGVAGQEAPPAIITYQTGAAFTRDNNDLSIGMAQWELS
ncbi:phosphate ABC transporter substrate-binding protein, partial [Pseudomonas putida]|nr:phosphate ABC transporter substrate-binding protein [Pseudomonas putida]